jgi:two-component system sensor histidine kinase YesM
VTISDNGKGMPRDVADNINAIFEGKDIDTSKIGIGIRNAFSRMKLFFGSNVSVLLNTEQGKGCEFRFLLPVPEGKLY